VDRKVVEVAGRLYVEAPKSRKFRATIYPARTPEGYPLAANLAIDQVTEAFGLSAGERAFLLSAGRGQALLAAGTSRAGFEAVSSPAERQLVTTSPEFLASLEAEEANSGG
jgi:hypothetical protein